MATKTLTLTNAEIRIARRLVMSGLIASERRSQPWQLFETRKDVQDLLAKLLEMDV
jgi:hypothetical protein